MKGGAIIPMGPVTAFIDREPLEIVRLDIYPQGDSQFSLYEDDGVTFAYETGAWATTNFRCRERPDEVLVTVGARKGRYRSMPANRSYLLSVHCRNEPARVRRGAEDLTRCQTREELVTEPARNGWCYDEARRLLWIKPTAGWRYVADERGPADPEKDTVQWDDARACAGQAR